MRNDRSLEWMSRGPKALIRAYSNAIGSIGHLMLIRPFAKLIALELEIEPDTGRCYTTPDRKLGRALVFAEYVVKMRDETKQGDEFVSAVEEEFGAVADGIAEFGEHAAHSFHRLAIDVAFAEVLRVIKAVGFGAEEEDAAAYQSLCGTFTAEAITPCILGVAENAPKAMEQLGIAEHDSKLFAVRLRQEVFRAWKRMYPRDSAKYETWMDPDLLSHIESATKKNKDSTWSEIVEAARRGLTSRDIARLSSVMAGENLSDAEQRIIEIVAQAGRRLTTDEVIDALEKRYGAASVGTTKVTLAGLGRHGLLINRRDVNPKGYGLPGWD